MPSPCVFPPIHIRVDGTVEIQGIRSAPWPFPGAISTYNGLAYDPATENGWAPPETGPALFFTSEVGPVGPNDGGGNHSGGYTGVVAETPAITVVNNDANRSALLLFIVSSTYSVALYGGSAASLRYSLCIPASTPYVGSTSDAGRSLWKNNGQGDVVSVGETFSYGVALGAGASITYNVTATYSLSAIANSSQVQAITLAGRCYMVHN